MSVKLTIEEMQEIAKAKKGKCLSTKYINSSSKLKWQCEKGHTWYANPQDVKRGHWCRVCGYKSMAQKQTLTIEIMQEIAKAKKGKCLSKKYLGSQTKLKWQCEKGHTWYAVPQSVKKGHWCPACAGSKKLSIKEMQEIAKKRKGLCLSNSYINAHTKLKWECHLGHQWLTKPSSIVQGGWCPYCNTHYKEEMCRLAFQQIFNETFVKSRPSWLVNSRGNKMELDGYCKSLKIAFEYQGEQHYKLTFFTKNKKKLKLRLKDDLRKKEICKSKNIFLFIIGYKNDISDIPKLIESQSKQMGLDVSKYYLNKEISYEPIYYDETIFKKLKYIAHKKGGKIISKSYLGADTKLEFQCRYGHKWKAHSGGIQRGEWCLECSGKRKKTIEEMQEIAKKKGGKCLSKKYTNGRIKLKWECKEGHKWEAQGDSVIQGRWCSVCSYKSRGEKRKLTIEEMKEIAKKKGGKCLSTKYINSSSKLKWQCEKSHTWETTPHRVKYGGTWCPICSNKKYN